jgi:hypothetical protein
MNGLLYERPTPELRIVLKRRAFPLPPREELQQLWIVQADPADWREFGCPLEGRTIIEGPTLVKERPGFWIKTVAVKEEWRPVQVINL